MPRSNDILSYSPQLIRWILTCGNKELKIVFPSKREAFALRGQVYHIRKLLRKAAEENPEIWKEKALMALRAQFCCVEDKDGSWALIGRPTDWNIRDQLNAALGDDLEVPELEDFASALELGEKGKQDKAP